MSQEVKRTTKHMLVREGVETVADKSIRFYQVVEVEIVWPENPFPVRGYTSYGPWTIVDDIISAPQKQVVFRDGAWKVGNE